MEQVKEEIFYNDEYRHCKPRIATLHFDKPNRPLDIDNNIHQLPFLYKDEQGQTITPAEAFQSINEDYNQHHQDDDQLLYGQVATGYDMERDDSHFSDDAVINVLKSTVLGQRKWIPRLTRVTEEDKIDLKIERQGQQFLLSSARKRSQGRRRHWNKKHNQLHHLVKHGNGIYRGLLKMQDDSGANRTVTGQRNLLLHYEPLSVPYPIGGVKDGVPAIHCTGKGYLPWFDDDNEMHLVRAYYSSDVNGTIMSPSDFAEQHSERFSAWNFYANMDTGSGQLVMISRDGINNVTFSAFKENNLWYHYLEQPSANTTEDINHSSQAIVKALTDSAAYEIWHNRLGHPGTSVMDRIHTAVKGIPKLRRNDFHSCNACLAAKLKKKHIGPTKSYNKVPTPDKECGIGQHLHMDFGFVRGSDWKAKDNDGKLVTSVDNFRSYLLVIDRASRYIWIFLTKTKKPPIAQVKGLLERFKGQYRNCTVTTDLGKELGASKQFQTMVNECKYVLKTTGAHSSAQNGLAEKPNQDLARMMRAMLYGAGLGSKYWSYALRHAVYLKNRLPHSSLNWITPYEKMNGTQPDLSRLKVFGSRVLMHNGNRRAKLDDISSVGTFLTYKGTDKILYVKDKVTNEERVSTHAEFDEAYMGDISKSIPPMATALQQAGYRHVPATPTATSTISTTPIPTFNVKRIDDDAVIPKRGTVESAGLDICSVTETIIPPQQQALLGTGLIMEIPSGFYGQLQIRSSLALKHQLELKAGLIDSDYRGEVKMILYNNGLKEFAVNKGDRVAQLVLNVQPRYELKVTNTIGDTSRGTGGFGSTGIRATEKLAVPTNPDSSPTTNPNLPMPTTMPTDEPSHPLRPRTTAVIPFDDHELQPLSATPLTTAPAAVVNKTTDDIEFPQPSCNICLSDDPFIDKIVIPIKKRGNHATLGLVLQDCPHFNDRVIITECAKATPAARISRWRSRIKNNTLLAINDLPVESIQHATDLLQADLPTGQSEYLLTIGQLEKTSMHDEEGIPMLYFDQLAMIGKHLDSIKHGSKDNDVIKNPAAYDEDKKAKTLVNMMKAYWDSGTIQAAKAMIPPAILPKSKQKQSKLTRRKLMQQANWNEWKASEFKQLDQYHDQDTFGEPCELPKGANVLNLLWAYAVKDDGRLKARCVCNGRPSNKNTAIFGYTYAKSLDQVGSRLFWATAAAKNMIVRGADASNAFAEADAPKIPLYVRMDQPYREWWQERNPGKPPPPPDFVLPVKKALQGHPESPRSWATLINKILTTKFDLKPTTHEPCLYHGTFKGHEVLFMRQVDDFAIACKEESITTEIIQAINQEMTIEIKDLGLLNRYNGVDITQARHYIKLSNRTYLEKILEGHRLWMNAMVPPSKNPLPIPADKDFIAELEQAVAPTEERDIRNLQLKMGFNYRQAIGELIYAMVTCRPDISYPLIKLSQYSTKPAEVHYKAVQQIFLYLQATIDDGLIYWRPQPNLHLPMHDLPSTRPSTYEPSEDSQPDSITTMHAAVDADWAGDTSHRKSVTGLILRLAGGTILYKTKYQDTIAMSSTEAEFTAACDAGKAILYVRSILDEINMPQEAATTLFIDNNGAMMMGNAQQPTRRTRHMDIKKFVLIDWIERDLIIMKRITTSDNYSDTMTKQVGRVLHHRHFDYIMGRIIPKYVNSVSSHPPGISNDVLPNMGGV